MLIYIVIINELNNEITNERKKNEWKNEIKNNEKIITMEQRLIKEWNEMIELGKNERISDTKHARNAIGI